MVVGGGGISVGENVGDECVGKGSQREGRRGWTG